MSSVIRGSDDFDTNGPLFAALIAANQNIPNNVDTKLLFGTEVYDTAGCYDPALSRFTPNKAGLYMVNGMFTWSAPPANSTTLTRLSINKNGVQYKYFDRINSANVSGATAIAALVYFNGTTDYIELSVLQNSGATLIAATGSVLNEFSAFRVAKG